MDVLLVALTIIGGLVGFLKDRNDKASENPKRSVNSPRPTPTPSGGAGSFGRNTQMHTEDTISIEEMQQEQRERLAERMNTATKSELDDLDQDKSIGEVNRRPAHDFSKERRQFRGRIRRNMSRSGLVNGIVMAEVLGPPRAVKPYRSVVEQRRK